MLIVSPSFLRSGTGYGIREFRVPSAGIRLPLPSDQVHIFIVVVTFAGVIEFLNIIDQTVFLILE